MNASPNADDRMCGAEMHFPPARCTRSVGHPGEHVTEQIPAPLSAVAARMVVEADRLEADGESLRQTYALGVHRLKIAFALFVGAAVCAVAAVVAVVTVAFQTVP